MQLEKEMMLKKEFPRNDVEEDFERLNCFSPHKKKWCWSTKADKPLQLILGNTVQLRDCQATRKEVRYLSCYHVGLYTQIFVNHFPPSVLSVSIFFFPHSYFIISAQPLQHFPPICNKLPSSWRWVKCASILTTFWHTSLVTLLPVKADSYRNFLLQVPSAQTNMVGAEFWQKPFCFAGQVFLTFQY